MASTPLDIIDNGILPRLPAKSLVLFKCVSKNWLALISSHEFIFRHLDYALSSNSNQLFILTGNDCCLYSFNLDLPKTPAVKLPSFGVEPFVVGSCNGLLCIRSYRPYCLVLLNPSTGSYREIPSLIPPRRCSALNFGFGYDCDNDDYKVVRIVDRYPSMGFLSHQMDRIVHVYSLRANSWEVIQLTTPQDSMGNRENGALITTICFIGSFGVYRKANIRSVVSIFVKNNGLMMSHCQTIWVQTCILVMIYEMDCWILGFWMDVYTYQLRYRNNQLLIYGS